MNTLNLNLSLRNVDPSSGWCKDWPAIRTTSKLVLSAEVQVVLGVLRFVRLLCRWFVGSSFGFAVAKAVGGSGRWRRRDGYVVVREAFCCCRCFRCFFLCFFLLFVYRKLQLVVVWSRSWHVVNLNSGFSRFEIWFFKSSDSSVWVSPDAARKGLVHRCSVLAVVVIHVPSELFSSVAVV